MLYSATGSQSVRTPWELDGARERAAALAVEWPHPQLRHTFCSHLAMREPRRGDSRAGWPCGPLDDDALHAPVAASLNQAIRLLDSAVRSGATVGQRRLKRSRLK